MSMFGLGKDVAAAREAGEFRLKTHFMVANEDGELVFQKSRTKQEFVDEQDIGTILGRATSVQAQGWMEANDKWLEQIGVIDVPNLDYKETLDIIADGERRFLELPSKVRAKFDNDATTFMDFVQDEKGDIALIELLAEAKPPIVKKDPKEEPLSKTEIAAAAAKKAEDSGKVD